MQPACLACEWRSFVHAYRLRRPISLQRVSQRLSSTATTARPAPLSVAPMLDVTDSHFRFLMRLISPDPNRITLYTEMRSPHAVLRHADDLYRFMGYASPGTIPQLAGSDPGVMAAACEVLWMHGYIDPALGVNINSGCPATSAVGNAYGAALMRDPQLVARMATEMRRVLPVHVPISVKCRLGVDNDDTHEFLHRYVATVVAESDVRWFVVHARKAWLRGLNPKQNRAVPPLNYERVWDLKRQWPQLRIDVNGGIETPQQALDQLAAGMDGVMVGRKIHSDPFSIRAFEKAVFDGGGEDEVSETERERVLFSYAVYADCMQGLSSRPFKLSQLIRPMFYLYGGTDGRVLRDQLVKSLRTVSPQQHTASREPLLLHLLPKRALESASAIENGVMYRLTEHCYQAMLHERARRKGPWSVPVKKSDWHPFDAAQRTLGFLLESAVLTRRWARS